VIAGKESKEEEVYEVDENKKRSIRTGGGGEKLGIR
jgi:hypothetical protein